MQRDDPVSPVETHEPPLKSPASRWAETVLASALTLAAIAWALDLVTGVGIELYDAQFYGLMMTLALPLAFIALPAKRRTMRTATPWYDWILAAAAFAASAWLIVRYDSLVDLVLTPPAEAVIPSVVLIALALEGLRRATGWTLLIVSLVFIAYALVGGAIPGRAGAQPIYWDQLAAYVTLDINGILGSALAVATTIVIIFVFFGHILTRSGGSAFFTDAALLGLGRMRGGPAKVAVVGSGLMGSISGSAVANVVATGTVTIPMIRRGGYPAHKAAAIEAVSSTGGQLMPPVMGASAFLMAEFLAIPYSTVIAAALIPGVLYYMALFIQADLDAGRRGVGGVAKEALPRRATVARGVYFILPFAVLLLAMVVLNMTPQKAALLACVFTVLPALVFGYGGERPSLRQLASSVRTAGMASLEIILICVAAGIVIGVLSVSGLSFNLTYSLVEVGGGSLLLLLLLAGAVSIVLGMGLPTVGVYVLLAALVAPALVSAGVEPIAAHLYVIYFGMMSMITPPIAIAAFAAAGLAKADPMSTAWSSVSFGWIAYLVPVLFVLSPTLLLIGEPLDILIAIVTAGTGVWLVSIAIAGFFVRILPPPMRIAFAAAGLAALVPAGAFPGAGLTDIAGVLAGAALIVWELRARAGAAPETRTDPQPEPQSEQT